MTVSALYAEFVVKAGSEGRVAELVRELTASVRAEAGNIAFEPYTLAAEPRRYLVYEVYRDASAFAEHLAAEHSARFNRELAGLIEGTTSELVWLAPLER